MLLILNKEKFFVDQNEFPIYKHPEYTTLILRPQLGIYEREISLIKNLYQLFSNSIFINYGLTHGGYVPLKLVNDIENIYIINKSKNDNFNKNKEIYDLNNKITIKKKLPKITDQIIILRCDKLIPKITSNTIILSYDQMDLPNHNHYQLDDSDLSLYIPNNLNKIFKKNYEHLLSENILHYDNLINLCIMVKNAGDGFREILEKNLSYIDQYTILDTGSTDNTINIMKDVLKNKKGNLYQEPFINFRDSRNRCLDLAGKECKYNVMLDDTYILTGNVRKFLNLIRSDEFADSYNISIQSSNIIYGSNRITKSDRNLRYTFKLHEIIQQENNVCVQVPHSEILIQDIDNKYMQERTKNRKKYDLEILLEEVDEYPDIPRHLYYVGQTYSELKDWQNAFDYFGKRIDHPIEGYREEVTDCYFLRAKIADEHLNYDWNNCEEMYLQCFEHEPLRSDPLFMIGYHYYQKNDHQIAYEYFRKGFKLGFPNLNINLRVDIYNKYLPQFLTELCYKFKDYKLGQDAAYRYLQNHHDNTINSYYKIFELLNKNEYNNTTYITGKPILCFVADGGFKEWSGSSINKEGVGGSETFIIEMARNIAKLIDFDIYVFCKCSDEEICDSIKYKKLNEYIPFINQYQIHTCIISRFSEYIPITLENNIDNVYLVVHDLLPSGNIIPMTDKMKGIFCMSDWHREYFLQTFSMLKDRTFVFPNGINIDKYLNINKKKNTFIYSSFPNRGLINLLKMFPKIRKRMPDATLNIFCNTKNNYVQSVAKEEMNEVDKLLEEQKDYVTNHGWVTKDVLRKYWLESEYWLYPCTFQETFCVTALEAAASGTLAICNNLAALNDTVGDRGLMINGDASSEEWQNEVIERLVNLTEEEKNELIEKNRKWSEEYDWIYLAYKFVVKYIDQKYLVDNVDIKNEECDVNFNISLYKNEYISNYIRNYKVYDKYSSQILMEIFNKNPNYVFVDIGANIGYFSLLAASKNMKVVAFEPINENYTLLNKSIKYNKYDKNIKLYKTALGSKEDKLQFNIYKTNMGLCSENNYNDNNVAYTQIVECNKFDSYINNYDDISLIVKIDVENMEYDVLKGMEKSLENNIIEYILIEISSDKNLKSIIDLLKKYNFSYIYDISINTTNIGGLEKSSYLDLIKYRQSIDKYYYQNSKQKNLLFCKSDNKKQLNSNENVLNINFINNHNLEHDWDKLAQIFIDKYIPTDKITNILDRAVDSNDYYILINAVKKIKGVPGLTMEIGVREGGSSYMIMKTLLENNDIRHAHIGVDPYGNLDYTHWENLTQKLDYTNKMKNKMMKNLYTWCDTHDINFIMVSFEDTEFFNRFSDGVPIYIDKKIMMNEYALVFFDGPHNVDHVLLEINFFISRTPSKGIWIFDDINQYPHMEKLDPYILSLGFERLDKSEYKISYQRI